MQSDSETSIVCLPHEAQKGTETTQNKQRAEKEAK
jgi:hypothetical protein